MNEISPPSAPLAAALSSAEAAVPAATTTRHLPFEFRATGAEYFRIWIVNLLLTIVTIGIYSAWAKVRRLRYFYGSTVLDGASFEYHGSPVAILKGRLLTVAAYGVFALVAQFYPLLAIVLVPLVLFGLPWVIAKARLFQMRMSSYRGLRFNFHGSYAGALGAYTGWGLVALFTLYLMLPLWAWKRVNYLLGNSSYAGVRFNFKTPLSRFFGFGYAAAGIALLVFIAAGVVIAAVAAEPASTEMPVTLMSQLLSVEFWITLTVSAVATLTILGFYQSRLLNASFGGLELGPHQLRSTLRAMPLIGLYLRNLVLLVLTVGLYYPWAKVALMRYQLENMGLEAQGSLDEFVSDGAAGSAALGEEVGDFFDVDFGL